MATFPIIGVLAGTPGLGWFTVTGNETATFTGGTVFSISGSQGGGIDGLWTATGSTANATFGSPDTETRITVTANIPTQGLPFGIITEPPLSGSPSGSPAGSPISGSPVGGSPSGSPTGSPSGSPILVGSPSGSPILVGSPSGSPIIIGSPLTGSPLVGSPPSGSPLFSGSPINIGSPINTGSPIGDSGMFVINHLYTVDDTVYYVDNNSVKSGVVVKVEITVTASGTVINYLIRVGSSTVTKQETDLYGNCKAEGGYQNAVFTANLSTSTVMIPEGALPIGSVLRASAVIDGGPPKAFTLTITAGSGSPAVSTVVTVQDILNNLNSVLTPVADAHVVQNNIRITSRSKGASSTVDITDGALQGSPTGSPLEFPYFETLATFTGLGSPVDGIGDGALEALGSQIC